VSLCLVLDPQARPGVGTLLQHPYMEAVREETDSAVAAPRATSPSLEALHLQHHRRLSSAAPGWPSHDGGGGGRARTGGRGSTAGLQAPVGADQGLHPHLHSEADLHADKSFSSELYVIRSRCQCDCESGCVHGVGLGCDNQQPITCQRPSPSRPTPQCSALLLHCIVCHVLRLCFEGCGLRCRVLHFPGVRT
jgi:hypothetical protein